MKKRMWGLLLFPVISLSVAVVFYWEFFESNFVWFLASILLVMTWMVFIGLVFNINEQVNENPYYAQMVLRKREQVRELQRDYAATHKDM